MATLQVGLNQELTMPSQMYHFLSLEHLQEGRSMLELHAVGHLHLLMQEAMPGSVS